MARGVVCALLSSTFTARRLLPLHSGARNGRIIADAVTRVNGYFISLFPIVAPPSEMSLDNTEAL